MADLIQNEPFVEAKTFVGAGGIYSYATTRKLRFTRTKDGRVRLPMVGESARGSFLEIEPKELQQVLDLLFPGEGAE